MNAAAYPMLLRPWKTLGVASVYILLVWSSLGAVFHVAWEPRWLLTWLVGAPWLLGTFMAGPLHEVMHGSGALLLPRLGASLRKWHLLAGGLLVCLLVGVTKVFVPSIPVLSSVGLASAFFAFPCFSDHGRGLFRVYPMGLLALALIIALSGAESAYALARACPWTIGVVGLAMAQVALLSGFSRRSIRSRQSHYYASFQSRLFCPKIAERARRHFLGEKRRKERSRSWCYGQNDGSLFSWLRVAWYARLGYRRHPWLTLVFASLLVPMQVVAAASVFTLLDGGTLSPRAWLDGMIALGGMGPLGNETATKCGVFVIVLVPMLSLCVAISDLFPRMRYPLSRARTAELHFAFSMVQSAVSFIAPLLACLLLLWLALALTGQRMRLETLAGLATPSLTMLVFTPLAQLAGLFRRKWLYIAVAIVVGLLGVGCVMLTFFYPGIVSFGGAVGGVALYCFFAALYRLRLLRHYAAEDLVLELSPRPVPGGQPSRA